MYSLGKTCNYWVCHSNAKIKPDTSDRFKNTLTYIELRRIFLHLVDLV